MSMKYILYLPLVLWLFHYFFFICLLSSTTTSLFLFLCGYNVISVILCYIVILSASENAPGKAKSDGTYVIKIVSKWFSTYIILLFNALLLLCTK